MTDQVPPKDFATPTVAGQYSSTCLVCERRMEWADKRCRICTDCHKPQEQVPSKDLCSQLRALTAGNRLLGYTAAEEIERLRRPAHEREPPHCSTCGCGLAPEPCARWTEPAKHCQNGGDVCLAGNADGTCCPDDSCDIDDGMKTRDPRASQPPRDG